MESKIIVLKDICDFNAECLETRAQFGTIQYLDTGNITKNKIHNIQIIHQYKDSVPSRARRKVKNNTIIYSTVRPEQEHFGFIVQPDCNLIVSTGFVTIDVKNHLIEPKFLYYLLTQNSITRHLQSIANTNTSAYPSINVNDLGNLKFTVPLSKKNQEKIVSVLSSFDEKIELNNRINAELEAMAKTLYDYWFVQFDFPDKNDRPYKSSGGKMIYNPFLKREIPAGWNTASLWDIAEYYNGLPMQKYRPSSSEFLLVIKIKEMNEGFSEKSEKARVNIPSKAIVNNGDVLFSWSATLNVQIWDKGIGALNQHIFKVTSNKYPKTFYYFELLNYLNHFRMMADKRKTTMGHITQDHLKQSYISNPPLDLINRLHELIDPIFNKQLVLKRENQKLSQLRDWLLTMLINGQITVQ